jgi:integrase
MIFPITRRRRCRFHSLGNHVGRGLIVIVPGQPGGTVRTDARDGLSSTPSSANLLATARPIPLVPPVIHSMTKIELKGIAKVTAKGRTYWYAWRGGPRLHGEPGSPEFLTTYNEAIEKRRIPEPGRFRSLVTLYRASADFKNLAVSTKRNWGPWLDRIADYFGDLSIAQFDRPQKIRSIIRQWRNRFADKPRTADYGLQVLSRVLAYAVDPLGKIAANPCEGIKQLYSVDRSEIIWTTADIARLKATCSPEIAHAVDLAVHTGLRLGDVLRLSWAHVGDDAIIITTGKSKHRREAIIPLYDDLKKSWPSSQSGRPRSSLTASIGPGPRMDSAPRSIRRRSSQA